MYQRFYPFFSVKNFCYFFTAYSSIFFQFSV
uniref:Uncharacterized protein n=1 Tax=Myoviridae sp. ct1AP5 TaxID=2825017 RepID=A0A8S5UDW4_9CAUD|nr:MAG TPA: hypothetical protein [Myoviridae sp. ct1AP5]